MLEWEVNVSAWEEVTAEAARGVQPARVNQVLEELGEVVPRWHFLSGPSDPTRL